MSLSELFKNKRLDYKIQKKLETGVLAVEAEKTHKDSGYFRVSDLGYCFRKVFYARQKGVDFPVDVLRKFHAGIDSGKRAVKYLQRAGILWGNGWCSAPTCKGPSVVGNALVKQCHCGAWYNYSEMGIRNNKLKISGRVDAFIKVDKQVYLVENKSASTYYKLASKKYIEEKLEPNIRQGNMYLGMLRSYRRRVAQGKKNHYMFYEVDLGTMVDVTVLSEVVNLDEFALIYEDKNSNMFHPHMFKYNHQMYLEDVGMVQAFFADEDKVPEKQVTTRCKYCEFAGVCNHEDI